MSKGNGGIFNGRNALGTLGLGIDPPFPDVYGCNTNDQCQSGWCNTAIPVSGAAGQCQTKGKVNPGIGNGGEAGGYCSSNDNCAPGLTCDMAKKMCGSPTDPGNGCYIATQKGYQAGQAGLANTATTAALASAVEAGVFPSPDILSKLTACYNDGYSKGKAQAASDPCGSTANVKKVQSGLGRPATGVWTTDDQNTLVSSGKSFRTWAPMCSGSLPTPVKTSTPAVKPPVPPPVIVPVQPPITPVIPQPGGTTAASVLSNPLYLLAIGAVVIGGVVLVAAKKKGGGKGKKAGKGGHYKANKSRKRQRAAKKAWRTRRRNARRPKGFFASLFG